MIDQRIVDHYWQQAMQHKSIAVFDGDGLRHEFYLNQRESLLWGCQNASESVAGSARLGLAGINILLSYHLGSAGFIYSNSFCHSLLPSVLIGVPA